MKKSSVINNFRYMSVLTEKPAYSQACPLLYKVVNVGTKGLRREK